QLADPEEAPGQQGEQHGRDERESREPAPGRVARPRGPTEHGCHDTDDDDVHGEQDVTHEQRTVPPERAPEPAPDGDLGSIEAGGCAAVAHACDTPSVAFARSSSTSGRSRAASAASSRAKVTTTSWPATRQTQRTSRRSVEPNSPRRRLTRRA